MGFRRSRFGKGRHNRNALFCSYKNKHCIHYETKEKAEHALQFVNEYDDPNYVPVRVYHCDCGYWHLTSKQKKYFAA